MTTPKTRAEARAEQTPNVVVQNPNVRRAAGWVIGVTGLILGTVVAVDGSTAAFDLSWLTVPVTSGYLYLASAFGLVVTVPNVPKR